jgi:hypothetical protein
MSKIWELLTLLNPKAAKERAILRDHPIKVNPESSDEISTADIREWTEGECIMFMMAVSPGPAME